MKKTLFLFATLFCLSSCGLFSQHVANPYMDAYEYIVKDMMTKRKYMAVSDSLFEFDKYTAMTLLKEQTDSSFRETGKDMYPTIDGSTPQVSVKVSNPIHLLRFSKFENNMILSEVIDYEHFSKYGDRFTTMRQYLFIFDDKMKIKKVTSTNLQTE